RLGIAEVAPQPARVALRQPGLFQAQAGFHRPAVVRTPADAGGRFGAALLDPRARAGQDDIAAVLVQPVVAAQGVARCLEAGQQRQPRVRGMGQVDAGDGLAGVDVLPVARLVLAFAALLDVALAPALAGGHRLDGGAAAELADIARADLGLAVVLVFFDAFVIAVAAGQRAGRVGGFAARGQVQRQPAAGQRLPPVRLGVLLALGLAHVPARAFRAGVGIGIGTGIGGDAAVAAVVVQLRQRTRRHVQRAFAPAPAVLDAQRRRGPAVAGDRAGLDRPFAAGPAPANHIRQHRVAAHVDAGRAGVEQFDAFHVARRDLPE